MLTPDHNTFNAGLAHRLGGGCPDGVYSRIGETLLLAQALAISLSQGTKRALQLEICRLGAVALQAVCLFMAPQPPPPAAEAIGGASPAPSEASEPSEALGELLQATVAFADAHAVAAGSAEAPRLPPQAAWLAAAVATLDRTVRCCMGYCSCLDFSVSTGTEHCFVWQQFV